MSVLGEVNVAQIKSHWLQDVACYALGSWDTSIQPATAINSGRVALGPPYTRWTTSTRPGLQWPLGYVWEDKTKNRLFGIQPGVHLQGDD